jgi:hypothetical protein
MNGVVFQISARQITRSDVHLSPNQSVSAATPGSQANHELTNPVLMSKANCQAKADTTVMTAYGMRMAARTTGRIELSAFAITMASPKPRTSSTDTVTTVMNRVTAIDCHHRESVRMTQ